MVANLQYYKWMEELAQVAGAYDLKNRLGEKMETQ
jgi:hypothetical protein